MKPRNVNGQVEMTEKTTAALSPEDDVMKSAEKRYRKLKIKVWDKASAHILNPKRIGNFYDRLIIKYLKFLSPSNSKVIELGCGHGNLLAAVKPGFGVGIDFSAKMLAVASQKHPELDFVLADVHQLRLKTRFDVVILSDLINDLWDVQQVFDTVKALSHSRTRVILNFYSNLWRLPLGLARRLGWKTTYVEQNWLAPNDVVNLLDLAGFEVINRTSRILFPIDIKYISGFLNRYLSQFIPFRWFNLANFIVARPVSAASGTLDRQSPSVSVIVAARNEAGNIEDIVRRVPQLGERTEIVFVEGNSKDNTYETINKKIKEYPEKNIRLFKQPGKGKGDAVRLGFAKATGKVLMILDADLTGPPEDLPRFLEVLASARGDFVNGVRLVYPMEDEAMRFFNIMGNKFFSLVFTWLLGQPIKDTLCGTKVLWKRDYEMIAANRSYFGDFDPFGDFDLLFGAAKLNFKIVEMPIRYRARTYGDTNIQRWRHGWLLLKMVHFAAKRIKFI
jgi:hypothetical protein